MQNKGFDGGGELVVDVGRLPSGAYHDPSNGYLDPYGGPASPGVVGPGVVFHGGQTVFVAHPPPTVREQYCLCAPETPKERRLLVAVVVLAVACVALLTTLACVLPIKLGMSSTLPGGENIFFMLRPDAIQQEMAGAGADA